MGWKVEDVTGDGCQAYLAAMLVLLLTEPQPKRSRFVSKTGGVEITMPGRSVGASPDHPERRRRWDSPLGSTAHPIGRSSANGAMSGDTRRYMTHSAIREPVMGASSTPFRK